MSQSTAEYYHGGQHSHAEDAISTTALGVQDSDSGDIIGQTKCFYYMFFASYYAKYVGRGLLMTFFLSMQLKG